MLRVLFIIFLITFTANGQPPLIQWTKCYGGTDADEAFSVTETHNGFLISGWADSMDGDITTDPGSTDGSLMHIDSLGNLLWERTLGGSYTDALYDVKPTIDGGYIAIGNSGGSPDGDVGGTHGLFSEDVWVVKMDSNRNVSWHKTYGGTDGDWAIRNVIEQTVDSGFIFIAQSASNDGDVIGAHACNGCSYDMWVVKIDFLGNIQWQKCLGGTDDEFPQKLHETTDNGYIICGYTYSYDGDITNNHGSIDAWVVKLDSFGNVEWQRCFGGTNNETFRQIKETPDSGFICIGSAASNDGDVNGNNGGEDIWIVKINSGGNLQWQKCIGTAGNQFATDMDLTEDSGLVLTYMGDNLTDFAIIKTDSLGTIEWQKIVGGSEFEDAASIKQTQDGGYIVTGYTTSNDGDVSGRHGNQICGGTLHCSDYWVVKLAPDGVNTIKEIPRIEATTYFNKEKSQLLIELNTLSNRTYFIQIADLTGRVISYLDRKGTSGYTEIQMPLNIIDYGIYFVQITDGIGNYTNKILIF